MWGEDFPGGSVVKNPSANAGDMGSSPDPGRIPYALEQPSRSTTTIELVVYSPYAVVLSPYATTIEPMYCNY